MFYYYYLEVLAIVRAMLIAIVVGTTFIASMYLGYLLVPMLVIGIVGVVVYSTSKRL